MAQKKPLVLGSDGLPQNLQPGDYITSTDYPQLSNGNAGSIVIGMAVYASANDTVDKARADAAGTSNVIGLVADASIAAAAVGGVIVDGILAATTTQWDAVAGTTGGLTKDVHYFLSGTTAGSITSTAPTTGYNVYIGIAISTTELKVMIGKRIKL